MNTTFLENALICLQEGFSRYQKDTSDAQIRDGLIQRFEFTYDLSCKTLKRYLESVSARPEEYDSMPFADLIRSANEQGLLQGNWPVWKDYRHMRNKTSHTYDEAIAIAVVKDIPAFIKEIEFLLSQLQDRLNEK